MSEPIDIKTKKIVPKAINQGFDKSMVHEALQKNIISHWDTWGKLQSLWTNRAYKTFKDFDKYLVLIYLVRDSWQQSADKFEYYVYGGAYTEPLLNPYFMDFIRLTKKNNAYFGIHTNGSQLVKLHEKNEFCTELVSLMENEKDYISISLDGGTPKSHSKTKNIKYDAWTDIIKGIQILVDERKRLNSKGTIRVAYLLNKWNSSEKELKNFINIMKETKVDSLRFSIPYAQYGNEVKNVQSYKRNVENKEHEKFTKLLEK